MTTDLMKLLDAARAAGWRVLDGGKHIKLFPADPRFTMVVISRSASDQRALQNIQAQLKARGLEVT